MARHTRLLSRFTTHWRVWGFHKLEWRVVSPMAPLEIFSGRREAISIAGRDGRDYAEAMTSPAVLPAPAVPTTPPRSEEHTSELQSLMRNSYAVFCLKKKNSITYS